MAIKSDNKLDTLSIVSTDFHGGGSNDTFVVESGYNVIVDDGGFDEVHFGVAYKLADMTYAREGNDLVIAFSGVATVRLLDQFKNNSNYTLPIEKLKFSNGDIVVLADLVYTTQGTVGPDFLLDTAFNDILMGLGGNDTLQSFRGDDTLLGGDGNDVLNSGDGGKKFLDGGAGHDVLHAGSGINTIVIGDGDDVGGSAGGYDTLLIDDTYAPEQLTFVQSGKSLEVHYKGVLAATIVYQWQWDNQIEKVKFSDGTLVDVPSAISYVTSSPFVGSARNDLIFGSNNGDSINGGAGDDEIFGNVGIDVLNGGPGNDTLWGGSDYDTYIASAGHDVIGFGEPGRRGLVQLWTGLTIDDIGFEIAGGSLVIRNLVTDDTIELQQYLYYYGRRTLDDIVLPGVKKITESDFVFKVQGTNSADTLRGSRFEWRDKIFGLGGDDVIVGSLGTDTLDGGEGFDTASYTASRASVVIDLENPSASKDVLISIEGVNGSRFDDILLGDAHANTLNGFGGNDSLDGRSGDDTLNGGAGNDTVDGGDGDDVLAGGGGNDLIVGGQGIDTLDLGNYSQKQTVDLASGTVRDMDGNVTQVLESIENVIGAKSNDTLYGSEGDNILLGGVGADVLSGRGGNDTLDGGADKDTVSYLVSPAGVEVDLAHSGMETGEGRDTFISIENLQGSQHNDTLSGDDGNNVLEGLDGDDIIYGGGGHDILKGGQGANVLDGGAGGDVMYGGLGNDTYFIDGVDWISDPGGADVIQCRPDQLFEHMTLQIEATSLNILFDGVVAAIVSFQVSDSVSRSVETIRFADGASYDLTKLALSQYGTPDDDSLTGNKLSQYLYGLGGDDTLDGNSGHDTLSGGDGSDLLIGGTGNDVLTGGLGKDYFVFKPGSGSDTIADFSYAQRDVIYIHGYTNGVVGGAGVVISQSGADAVIDLGGGNVITVLNTVATDDGFLSRISW